MNFSTSHSRPVALGPERDPDLVDLVRLEALFEQRAESARVARVRVHRGHRRLTDGQVVGVRTAHRRVQHAAWDVRDHQLRLVLADHAHDVATQLQVGRQVAILVAEKLHPLHSQHPRRRTLLPDADRDQLGVLLGRVLAALTPVGDDDVRDLRPAVGQPCDRATGSEVGVVGMRRDHHHALELGQSSVAARCRHGNKG